jgi:hypothetical protein
MNKHVFEKIAKLEKTELSEVKVDLALADDVKKSYQSAINARKKSFDIMQNLKKSVDIATKDIQNVINENQNALTVFDKFDAAAKALGIPAPKEIIDQKTNIQDGLKGQLAMYVKQLQSIKIS